MTKPRVSVVMPAHNEGKSVGNLVISCKALCDEIIVVDNGSTDNTAAIAKESGAIVVRNEENLGVAKATQKGFEIAHGDIIVTIDADGQHDPSDILKLTRPLMEGRCEVTLGVRDEILFMRKER